MDSDILAQIFALSQAEFALATGGAAFVPLLVSHYAGRIGELVAGAFDAGADHIFPIML